MKKLEDVLRDSRASASSYLVVRGSPNTVAKLMETASRMASQWTLRGDPIFGVSVNIVADEVELDALLRTTRYRTRHHYRHGRVGVLLTAGFIPLPTFADPTHHTLELVPYTRPRARDLLDVIEVEHGNPYYGGRNP